MTITKQDLPLTPHSSSPTPSPSWPNWQPVDWQSAEGRFHWLSQCTLHVVYISVTVFMDPWYYPCVTPSPGPIGGDFPRVCVCVCMRVRVCVFVTNLSGRGDIDEWELIRDEQALYHATEEMSSRAVRLAIPHTQTAMTQAHTYTHTQSHTLTYSHFILPYSPALYFAQRLELIRKGCELMGLVKYPASHIDLSQSQMSFLLCETTLEAIGADP